MAVDFVVVEKNHFSCQLSVRHMEITMIYSDRGADVLVVCLLRFRDLIAFLAG